MVQAFCRSVKEVSHEAVVSGGRPLDAVNLNFLMDRSEENWAAEFVRLNREAGACRTTSAIMATGALAGDFTWVCERGVMTGSLLLAPTNPPTIQALRLAIAPPR